MADNTRRLAGIASLTIEGTTYQLVGDLKYGLSIVERKSLMGMDGYHGYQEDPQPGFLEFTVRDSAAVSGRTFAEMTNVSVVVIASNGKSVSGQELVCMKQVEVDAAEAKIALRFEGPDVRESK